MHILIISRSYPNKINKSSGNFVQNQVEALSQHTIQIGVLGVYNVSLKELIKVRNIKQIGSYIYSKKNVKIYEFLYPVLPKLHFINNKIKVLIGKKLLKKYIHKNGRPDIIHLHTFELGRLALWAKKIYNIPYVVTEHTSLFYLNKATIWHQKLAYKIYRESSYNIGVSKNSATFLENKFNTTFHYLPNFIDTSTFSLKKERTDKTINFINVAYLTKNKNQHILINAFNKAFGNNEQFQLTIVGNGPEMQNLISLCSKLKSTNIHLHGYANQNELKDLLHDSDFFVLSSNYETFGVVLIEAMSCGLPVISTKCGGPESIIINDKLGILCPKGNVDALSEALIRATKKKYNSNYIREYIIQNFSYEYLSKKLITIYSEVQ